MRMFFLHASDFYKECDGGHITIDVVGGDGKYIDGNKCWVRGEYEVSHDSSNAKGWSKEDSDFEYDSSTSRWHYEMEFAVSFFLTLNSSSASLDSYIYGDNRVPDVSASVSAEKKNGKFVSNSSAIFSGTVSGDFCDFAGAPGAGTRIAFYRVNGTSYEIPVSESGTGSFSIKLSNPGTYNLSYCVEDNVGTSSFSELEGYEEKFVSTSGEFCLELNDLPDNMENEFYCLSCRTLSGNHMKSDASFYPFRIDTVPPEDFSMWLEPQRNEDAWYNDSNVELCWSYGKDMTGIGEFRYSVCEAEEYNCSCWNVINDVESRSKWISLSGEKKVFLRSFDSVENHEEDFRICRIDLSAPAKIDGGKKFFAEMKDGKLLASWPEFTDNESGISYYRINVQCIGDGFSRDVDFLFDKGKNSTEIDGFEENENYMIRFYCFDNADNFFRENCFLLSEDGKKQESIAYDFHDERNGFSFDGRAKYDVSSGNVILESGAVMSFPSNSGFFLEGVDVENMLLQVDSVKIDNGIVLNCKTKNLSFDYSYSFESDEFKICFSSVEYDFEKGMTLLDAVYCQKVIGEDGSKSSIPVKLGNVIAGFPSHFNFLSEKSFFENTILDNSGLKLHDAESVFLGNDEKHFGEKNYVRLKNFSVYTDGTKGILCVTDSKTNLNDGKSFSLLAEKSFWKNARGDVFRIVDGYCDESRIYISKAVFETFAGERKIFCHLENFSLADDFGTIFSKNMSANFFDEDGNRIEILNVFDLGISSSGMFFSQEGNLVCNGTIAVDLYGEQTVENILLLGDGFDFSSCFMKETEFIVSGYRVRSSSLGYAPFGNSGRIVVNEGCMFVYNTELPFSGMTIDVMKNRVVEAVKIDSFYELNTGYGSAVKFYEGIFDCEGLRFSIDVPEPSSSFVKTFSSVKISPDDVLNAVLVGKNSIHFGEYEFMTDKITFDGKKISMGNAFMQAEKMKLFDVAKETVLKEIPVDLLSFSYDDVIDSGAWDEKSFCFCTENLKLILDNARFLKNAHLKNDSVKIESVDFIFNNSSSKFNVSILDAHLDSSGKFSFDEVKTSPVVFEKMQFTLDGISLGDDGMKFSGSVVLPEILPGFLAKKTLDVSSFCVGWDGKVSKLECCCIGKFDIPIFGKWNACVENVFLQYDSDDAVVMFEKSELDFPCDFLIESISADNLSYRIGKHEFDYGSISVDVNNKISIAGIEFDLKNFTLTEFFSARFLCDASFKSPKYPDFLKNVMVKDSIIDFSSFGSLSIIDFNVSNLKGKIDRAVESVEMENGSLSIKKDDEGGFFADISGTLSFTDKAPSGIQDMKLGINSFCFSTRKKEIICLDCYAEKKSIVIENIAFEDVSAGMKWNGDGEKSITLGASIILPDSLPEGIAGEKVVVSDFKICSTGKIESFCASFASDGKFDFLQGFTLFSSKIGISWLDDEFFIDMSTTLLLKEGFFLQGIGGTKAKASLRFCSFDLVDVDCECSIPDRIVFDTLQCRNLSFCMKKTETTPVTLSFKGKFLMPDEGKVPRGIANACLSVKKFELNSCGEITALDISGSFPDCVIYDALKIEGAFISLFKGKKNELTANISGGVRIVSEKVPSSLRNVKFSINRFCVSSKSGVKEFDVSMNGNVEFSILGGLDLCMSSLSLNEKGFPQPQLQK